MRRYIFYMLFGLIPLISACERAIPYDGEYQDPKLVIQTLVCAGEDSLTCYITHSYFFLESKPYKPVALDNLSIAISGTSGDYGIIADSVVDCAHHIKLSRPLLAGDTLHISVSHPQFGTAYADEYLLPDFVPEILSAVWEKDSYDPAKNLCRVRLRLPEYTYSSKSIAISGTGYYTSTSILKRQKDNVIRWDTIISSRQSHFIMSSDELFSEMGNRYSNIRQMYIGEPMLLCRSVYPKGKELELAIVIHSYYDALIKYETYVTYTLDSCKMTFEMTGQTYEMYQSSMKTYMKRDEDNSRNMDIGAFFSEMMGVEEPAAIYSNIENGYGILMSKTKTTIPIPFE